MRPQLLMVLTEPRHSFNVRRDLVPHVNNRWHYHNEIELIHFKRGSGTQFIGDSIQRFNPGDTVLVGANLPHYWRFDDIYFEEGGDITADVRVAHFSENFMGKQFMELPENHAIKSLLDKARRGIQITGKTSVRVATLLRELLKVDGTQRIILLLEALNLLSMSNEMQILSSVGFRQDLRESEQDRLNDIYEFSLKNYRRNIQLEEIASVANISPSSFCRYFKSRTKKTYSQFLIEIRVGQACKLLIENNMSVKQLCYKSGFNNFTSFYKYFKHITGKSPLNYQKEFYTP